MGDIRERANLGDNLGVIELAPFVMFDELGIAQIRREQPVALVGIIELPRAPMGGQGVVVRFQTIPQGEATHSEKNSGT